jgi:hypothetical protein
MFVAKGKHLLTKRRNWVIKKERLYQKIKNFTQSYKVGDVHKAFCIDSDITLLLRILSVLCVKPTFETISFFMVKLNVLNSTKDSVLFPVYQCCCNLLFRCTKCHVQ